jgi:hypothetical protein
MKNNYQDKMEELKALIQGKPELIAVMERKIQTLEYQKRQA